MSYALVHDVPASWEQYRWIARSLERVPPGSLLHVAGPTDEGFRIIEVWESELAWRQFSPDLEIALSSVDPDVRPRMVFRDLRAMHLGDRVLGSADEDLEVAGGCRPCPGHVAERDEPAVSQDRLATPSWVCHEAHSFVTLRADGWNRRA